LQYWAGVVKKAAKEKKLQRGFVPANNHCAGFGPATANMFRVMNGLPKVTWEEMKQSTLD